MTTSRSDNGEAGSSLPPSLALVDQASKMLAEARFAADIPHKVLPVIDVAEQMKLLAKQRDMGLDAINHAAALMLRAEHRAGELLKEAPIGKGIKSLTLSDLRLDKNQSARWQKLASLPVDRLEEYIEDCDADEQEATLFGALRVADRYNRAPRPTPIEDGVPGVDGPAPEGAQLLRFMQNLPTHVIVDLILRVFFPDASTVLDVTYGNGNFWGASSPYRVIGHDLDETRAPDGVMDFTNLTYEDASIEVVAIDTPHLADGGEDSVMAGKFGTVKGQEELENMIMAGAREAWRVCSKGMVIKVTDHTHGRQFNDMCLVVCDAIATWPYDKVHQVRDHAFIDPSWGEQLSAYNNGSTFLIFRKDSQLHMPRRKGQ